MELEERLRKLENECFNNTLRRQVDTHYMGRILRHLVSTGVVDGPQLKQAITLIGEDMKKGSNYAPDSVQTIEEHTAQWLNHIEEPKEFLLSGAVS
ncbi:hypothetical protein [Acinetobacter pseudolwoffii]|uniref:Uncharacterized protein n=1 Tax=Acinetobacter pseudolwoffii TaxID=2053287 RepID=A0A2H9UPF6_9GAMM|nr:hypothetical protein [Acinetobacter pseudolwoffii]PJI33567.1 hypothetical protein CU320_04005 [Acinetobacter pseudolwoffii]